MCADYALRRKGEYADIADQGVEADPGAAWQGLENQDEGAAGDDRAKLGRQAVLLTGDLQLVD